MKLIGFILIMMSNFLILWSVTGHSGHKSGNISVKKTKLLVILVSILVIWQVSARFLAVVAIETVAVIWLRKKKTAEKTANKLLLVDEIILTMQTGMSLEGSLRKVATDRKEFFKYFQLSETSASKELQQHEQNFVKMLSFCRKNNSLSFKVLKFYREIEKLREKLLTKEKTISLQAKAQALISSFLYLGIFMAQLAWNPDFSKVLATSSGKLITLLSFCFLLAGLWLVFKISKTSELEI